MVFFRNNSRKNGVLIVVCGVMVLEANSAADRDLPDYMDVDLDRLRGTFTRGPSLADVPYPVQMEPNLVIEFYSR